MSWWVSSEHFSSETSRTMPTPWRTPPFSPPFFRSSLHRDSPPEPPLVFSFPPSPLLQPIEWVVCYSRPRRVFRFLAVKDRHWSLHSPCPPYVSFFHFLPWYRPFIKSVRLKVVVPSFAGFKPGRSSPSPLSFFCAAKSLLTLLIFSFSLVNSRSSVILIQVKSAHTPRSPTFSLSLTQLLFGPPRDRFPPPLHFIEVTPIPGVVVEI